MKCFVLFYYTIRFFSAKYKGPQGNPGREKSLSPLFLNCYYFATTLIKFNISNQLHLVWNLITKLWSLLTFLFKINISKTATKKRKEKLPFFRFFFLQLCSPKVLHNSSEGAYLNVYLCYSKGISAKTRAPPPPQRNRSAPVYKFQSILSLKCKQFPLLLSTLHLTIPPILGRRKKHSPSGDCIYFNMNNNVPSNYNLHWNSRNWSEAINYVWAAVEMREGYAQR